MWFAEAPSDASQPPPYDNSQEVCPAMDDETRKALSCVARFYDRRKVGHVGFLGFRRSSDLTRMVSCIDTLVEKKFLSPGVSLFLDMGCGDGRVNLLLSYLVEKSVGIELDEWTLDEYKPLRTALEAHLEEEGLPLPPDNIALFHGDSTDEALHETIRREAGVGFENVDLFYTYLTMYEEFSRLITRKAKRGALFMVYGLEKILPRLEGLRLLTHERPLGGILALYEKI